MKITNSLMFCGSASRSPCVLCLGVWLHIWGQTNRTTSHNHQSTSGKHNRSSLPPFTGFSEETFLPFSPLHEKQPSDGFSNLTDEHAVNVCNKPLELRYTLSLPTLTLPLSPFITHRDPGASGGERGEREGTLSTDVRSPTNTHTEHGESVFEVTRNERGMTERGAGEDRGRTI